MPKLPTAKQVIDRIHWDDGLDEARFSVGYEERDRGIEELPLPAFEAQADIPSHRIRYLRCYGHVVWHRTQRINDLDRVRRSSGS